MYEVYLTGKAMGASEWQKLVTRLMVMSSQGEKVELVLRFEGEMLGMYLEMGREVPANLAGIDGVQFRKTEEKLPEIKALSVFKIKKDDKNGTIAEIMERLRAQNVELKEVRLVFIKMLGSFMMKTYFIEKRKWNYYIWRKIGANFELLNVDFRGKFLMKKPPTRLNSLKTLGLATGEEAGTVMSLEMYPYLSEKRFLSLKNYDFSKHTAVFGASGMGKTKFLAKMIERTAAVYGDKYHFLVIDPHDAIRQEIGGVDGAKVYDYRDQDCGIGLFLESDRDVVSSVDMTLALIKTLMEEGWNARLERLVRASLYLLMENSELSFQNMRRLLTDVAYKNALIRQVGEYLPESLQEFFLQDYNELKTQYYDVTFARVLALIDEMQLTPAFYRKNDKRLFHELTENKITIVSLSQAKLGEKPVKVLAGLIMNQLFLLGMQRKLLYRTILVVDEVAVVENPVLVRFLSEARKYGISVMLAGQYYAQITEELKTAIFANVVNYYCFRLNYDDAESLAKYLDIDLVSEEGLRTSVESGGMVEKIKMITTLSAREMLVKVERNGVPLPAIKGRSLDYTGKADTMMAMRMNLVAEREGKAKVPFGFSVKEKKMKLKNNVFDLMREQSTSRRKVN